MPKKKDAAIIGVVLLLAVGAVCGFKDDAQNRPFHQDCRCDPRAGRCGIPRRNAHAGSDG